MPRIFISPSDQYGNTYAGVDTNEGVQCNAIAKLLDKALVRCGFETMCNDNMYEAVKESNAWGADAHVPIHTNSFDGKVAGNRILVYAKSGKGADIAYYIFNQLAPLTPGTSDNINVAPQLYEIKNTVAPCVYIEVEFHDNPEAAKWITQHHNEIAEAICRGLCYYFNMIYVAPEKKEYYAQVGPFVSQAEADDFVMLLHQIHVKWV